MQAVIVSFESLATNSLGCYGNEWIETPHFDRLAASGAVFDSHFADTVGPSAGTTWATGRHSLAAAESNPPLRLGELLKTHHITSQLITSGSLREWQRQFHFDETLSVGGQDGLESRPDQTPFAEVVKGTIALSQEKWPSQPGLHWLHAPGPGMPPLGFDSLYFEDFQERGQDLAALSEAERATHPATYAGSVSLIDHWLGELLTELDRTVPADPLLFIVTAARGDLWQRIKPLQVSPSLTAMRHLGDQMARTPLIVQIRNDPRFESFKCVRSNRLVQSCDLVPTLLDWFEIADRPFDESLSGQSWLKELTEDIPARGYLRFEDEQSYQAVRTRDWLCIQNQRPEPPREDHSSTAPNDVSLFVKPEDLWDVNNIATQQPEVVASLLAHLDTATA